MALILAPPCCRVEEGMRSAGRYPTCPQPGKTGLTEMYDPRIPERQANSGENGSVPLPHSFVSERFLPGPSVLWPFYAGPPVPATAPEPDPDRSLLRPHLEVQRHKSPDPTG